MWLSGIRSIDDVIVSGYAARRCRIDGAPTCRQRWPVLLLCLFLVGCSATRIIYNKLDWFLVGYVGDFFTLDDEQTDWLDAAIERNLQWHRRDQLPKYAQFLRQIESEFSSGAATADSLERNYAQFIVLWDEFIVNTMPDITVFFLTLSDEQIEEFVTSLEGSNQEMWDEYAGETPEERRENRHDATIRGLKRMFGRLSTEQKDLVRTYQARMHDVSEEWIASRRQWQQDFRDLVVERPSDPAFSERMKRLLLEPNRDDDPTYRRRVGENHQIMISMMMALNAGLTDKQRERFSMRVKKYARNFDILASQET